MGQAKAVAFLSDYRTSQQTPSVTDSDPWAALLERIAQGDRQAFIALFRAFSPQILAFAKAQSALGDSHQLAEELVQEVMISVWQKAADFDRRKASAATWLFTIARNRRIDLLRKLGRHQVAVSSDELFEIVDQGATPPVRLQQEKLSRSLKDAFRELPGEQLQVVAKIYLEGKTHQEVAEEMALPLGTVKSRIRLALSKLKVLAEGWHS